MKSIDEEMQQKVNEVIKKAGGRPRCWNNASAGDKKIFRRVFWQLGQCDGDVSKAADLFLEYVQNVRKKAYGTSQKIN